MVVLQDATIQSTAHPMAIAHMGSARPLLRGQASSWPYADLVPVRSTYRKSDAASIEVTMGLDLQGDSLSALQIQHIEGNLRGPGSIFPPIDGGSGHQVHLPGSRAHWDGSYGQARHRPVPRDRDLREGRRRSRLSLLREFPRMHDEPPGEQDEHTVTKTTDCRLRLPAASSTSGVPFLSLDHELIYEFDIRQHHRRPERDPYRAHAGSIRPVR